MSKGILLRKMVCAFLCTGLTITGGIAQKNSGDQVAESQVRSYFTTHSAQYGLDAADLTNIKITSNYLEESINVRHIYVQQQFHGLDVVNAVAALHLKNGNVPVHATYQFAKLKGVTGSFSAFTPSSAVQKAMLEVGIPFPTSLQLKEATSGIDSKTVFQAANTTWDIPVRKAYLINEETKQLAAVWEVQLYRRDLQNYWIIYLDGTTGKVISKTDMVLKCDFGHDHLETDEIPNDINGQIPKRAVTLTAKSVEQFENVYRSSISPNAQIHFDDAPINNTTSGVVNQYRVYDKPYEAPNQAGATHSLVSTGGNGTASPDGWHKVANAAAFQFTRGNNVWAFQDPSPGPLGGVPSADPTRTAYNNGGTAGTPAVVEPFKFDYSVNLANEPNTYQNAAIINLFYWNNLMHDVFYQFGFTEANRNFEDSHIFSSGTKAGGLANDAVLAQAQDGGGTNNANFLTLADGTPGQMQMYLWTGSEPENIVRINSSTVAPPSAGDSYFAVQGSFGSTVTGSPNLNANPVLNKPFVIVQKNALSTVGTSSQGCATGQMSVALPPANDVSGKIVLIDRGGCSFVEKVLGAQLGNAAGVIVINNVPGDQPSAMGGTDGPTNAITIPAVMISFENGQLLKNALMAPGGSIIGTLKKDLSAAKRDGDLDNGVIAHEYGHGISTRLVAGGPNPTGRLTGNEQGGEGWSDNFALYMTTTQADLLPATAAHPNGILPNRGIGSYVTYQGHLTGGGIRPTRYSIDMGVNPTTYSYIKNPVYTVPHGIGYIWCSMLYEMQQELIDQYGFNDDVYNPADPVNGNVPAGVGGNNVAMRLVMQGLILTPAGPTFVDQRNAILKADTLLYGGQHACRIWRAFAKRGLGFSAIAGTNALGDEVEQFNTNPLCNPQSLLRITKAADALVNNGGNISYTITATNITPSTITLGANNLVITDTLPANTTFVSASDGGTLTGNVVTWSVTSLAQNATITRTLVLRVNHPTPAKLIFSEDSEAGTTAANKLSSSSTDPGALQQFNIITDASRNVGTGKVWFVQDYDLGGSNAILRTKTAVAIPTGGAQLIFNHKYAAEASYDGGVVETSVDGTNWTPLGSAAFSKNSYSGAITTTNNPLIGTATLNAFTGSSPGYIQSIASLAGNQTIFIRFRFTSDPTGGSVDNGGWWIDEVYLASPATFVNNTAFADATNGASKVNASASTLVIDNTILPVDGLKDLKAAVRNKTIVLSWETLFERDNRGFEVLRKAPGDADFTTIGFVNGAGTSSNTVPYTFTDASVKQGILYQYKLKQISTSGRLQYSNIVTGRIVDGLFAFSFSPNPARTSITFSVNNESRTPVTIDIIDVSGKKVKTINAGSESYINMQMSLQNFSKGAYLVTIRSGAYFETQKLVVE